MSLSGSELLAVRDLTAIAAGDVFRLVAMEAYVGGGVIRWVIARPQPGSDAKVREAMMGCEISTADGRSFQIEGAGAFGGGDNDILPERGEVAFTPAVPNAGVLVVELVVDRFEIPLS